MTRRLALLIKAYCGAWISNLSRAIFRIKEASSASFKLFLFGLKVDNTIEGSGAKFSGELARD
jgi:hypothetical protein